MVDSVVPHQAPTGKLSHRFIGFFTVAVKVQEKAYSLDLPQEYHRTSSTFNGEHLKPFQDPQTGRPMLKPPHVLYASGEPLYEVEAILDRKGNGRSRRYLMKWQGYPDDDNTWEPPSVLEAPLVKEMVDKFNAEQAARDKEMQQQPRKKQRHS